MRIDREGWESKADVWTAWWRTFMTVLVVAAGSSVSCSPQEDAQPPQDDVAAVGDPGAVTSTNEPPLLIHGDSFFGIRLGQAINSISIRRVRRATLATGEGDFDVYDILAEGGEWLGYFLPDPVDSTRVGDLAVVSRDAVTPEGIRVGWTYDEVRAVLDSFEVHGSEIESRTHVQYGTLSGMPLLPRSDLGERVFGAGDQPAGERADHVVWRLGRDQASRGTDQPATHRSDPTRKTPLLDL